jgi:hypothetical protein
MRIMLILFAPCGRGKMHIGADARRGPGYEELE